jgi:hypothetical protein
MLPGAESPAFQLPDRMRRNLGRSHRALTERIL